MKSDSSGRGFMASRAVEEPLEATFDLGENIKKVSGKLTRPVNFGIIGTIILLLILLPSIAKLILSTIDGFLGNLDLSKSELIILLVLSLMTILLLAITVTTVAYFIQIKDFNTHLIQRYSVVAELKTARIRDSAKIEDRKKIKAAVGKFKKEDKKQKLTRNPIFAMLDLVEESMHELPQLIRLLRICKYFIILVFGYLIITIIFKLIFNQNLLVSVTYWEYILTGVALIILVPALLLLVESESLFIYLQARHDIIDSVRFDKDIRVPSGKDKITRLLNYLINNDPFIKSLKIDNIRSLQNITKKGNSGNEHTFDLYFSINNELPDLSSRLGIPKGKLSVFIKAFKKPITLKSIQTLRDSVVDVCDKEDSFPIRIIAFQWQVEVLEDEVYEHVLENPIIIKNSMAHIQIVAEDGEIYSFIPLISYGIKVE
jgi:hypothetical protein